MECRERMQGVEQQQQQLAVLVAAATGESPSSGGEAERIAAVKTLHRSVLYPPNSLLVSHSASFLAQGFSKLLSVKSYAVRHAAATAYGAFCSVLCSILMSSNGRQNHVLGGLIDRFINWALPLLRNIRTGDGATELALQALREFINVGDVSAIERYALPILKASQELLEDERTSLSLLHQLLGVLTLIALKFFRFFQPHFVDIVDLLLGWVMLPDLADSDRRVIMDSFLQFQKHWVNGLPFSLGLLSKFLGDMEVQLKDGSAGSPQQFQRLLALLLCFCTVLQSTASGLLEMNLLEQIIEPLSQMIPLLFGCLTMVGRKFGWAKWISDSWRCLTLLAEILSERFSNFYPLAVDVLFQSLEMENKEVPGKVTSFHVHGVLKTNLQLLSLQKLGLLASSVQKILQFNSPISQLRLHPNHLVTGSCAATYIFLLQHRNNDVVEQAVDSLIEEIELIMSMLERILVNGEEVRNAVGSRSYSESELLAMIKFDLKVLLSCISEGGNTARVAGPEFDALYLKRSERLASFIMEKLDPFGSSIQSFLELQTCVIQTLGQVTLFQVFRKFSIRKQSNQKKPENVTVEARWVKDDSKDRLPFRIFNHLKKYTDLLTKALHVSSPLAVKLQAFSWIYEFCEGVIDAYEDIDDANYPFEAFGYVNVIGNLVTSVLNAALDREPKVRFHVASALESLLQAKLIHPPHFYAISLLVLEKLGDPDDSIKNAFMKIFSQVLPLTIYTCGLHDPGNISTRGTNIFSESSNLHWRQVFALKQVSQQLQSQQLVSILSFLSQRWKVPLSSWIQRLIHTCRSSKNVPVNQLEEGGDRGIDGLGLDVKFDEDILEKVSTVNILAGACWAIYEAARYCITTRLRTNLGGPTQTFAALERMLLDVAHVLHLDTEQSDGTLNLVGPSQAHLLPMRLLLEFVEALKKNVYNAYEGSTVLPCAARQSLLFFRANRKVCEEWFSRICEPMMNAGLTLQCHHATIHYCTLRLQELKNHVVSSRKDKPRGQIDNKSRYSENILRVVRHMAWSLCKVHEPEALIGLRKWATMTFSSLLTDENHNFGGDEGLGPFAWITGLVYQAKGQHEMAAAHFTRLLQEEESLSLMGSDGVQFVIARVIESYSAISDWKSFDSWLLDLQNLRAKHSGKGYSGALTASGNEINAIHALASFDEGNYQAARRYLDLTPKSSCELTLDPELAFQRSEQMLLQALLLHTEGKLDIVPQEIQKAKSMLEEALSVLPMDGLDEAAAHATQLYCISVFEESFKIEGSREKQSHSLLSSYIQVLQSPINEVRQECNMWLKVLRVHRSISPASPVTLKLSKNLLRLARKQGNLSLSNSLSSNVRDLVTSCPEVKNRDFLTRTLQYESILLMHAENKFEDAFSNLWSFLRPCFVSSPFTVFNAEDAFLNAKAFLKLSHWLRTSYSNANLENIIVNLLAEFHTSDTSSFGGGATNPADDSFSSKPNMSGVVEELIGTATKLSSQLCPSLGKSWISYASWCYNHARASLSSPNEGSSQSCSVTSILGPELIPDRFKLTEGEMLKVTSIVLQLLQRKTETENLNIESRESKDRQDTLDDMSNENLGKALVQQVVGIIEAAAGAPGAESSSGERLSCLVTSQLQKCFQFANAIIDRSFLLPSVGELVDIWWALRRRRVSLFGHAAQGFINYLSYSSSMHPEGNLAASFCDFLNKKTVSYTHRATLYVLDILLNFGVELKETLEPALSVAPLLPWQEITPQIFARVSAHPEHVVRKLLEGLLLVVAKLSPWTIVYPTLVDVNSSQGQPSEELQHILACLSMLYPRLIQDVQLVIKELENVTVLWEELWLSTLQDLHGDVMRRINLLKEEALRVEENVTLTQSEKNRINAAKYSAMMAPIIVVLERRLVSTSKKPETPHEIWFHEEYMEQIKSSIAKFRTPPSLAAAIGDVWRPFSNIATSLASYQRKASISLGEVAPQLVQLASSDVPIPGLERQIMIAESDGGFTNPDGIVTIASFGEHVSVLPTKTKPKKIVILGSDGQKYKYLLKGREDLRLDARIMQLLQVINGCLHSSRETRRKSLSIRYYSVTPISGRAGLIQWIDNVTSIYSIFKSWQSRAQLAQFQALGAANTKDSVPPPVPRPSDMFYGKIIPALKEKGIRKVISRRDWPHEVKRKVFLDLMNEVPEQLLHQELWCASEGFKAFNSKLRRFSGSVAAMSMVGHIMGLGDRHLDNILIDFSSGDILHIDYNVCFDKGQRLKIPEIVPFRLTRTMEATLGLTGIEGIFRADCEAVLGVLKKNKDIVLMLLEVFAWDPLVEWTRGDFPDDAAIVGEERKGMEVAVSLSLFASRVQEIRVPLQEHHDLLLSSLPSIESALESFASILDQYELVSVIFHHTDQEMSNLVMHETSAKSLVSEANSNFEKYRTSYETHAREFAQAKSLIADKAQEVTNWMEQHGRLLDTLRSSSIPDIKTYLQLKGTEEAFSLTSAVVVAGVPLTVVPEPTQAQCHDIDTDVSQLIAELDHGLNSVVQSLQAYSLALQRILPQNYLTTSPMHRWAQVLQFSVNNPTPDVLSFSLRQAAELIAEVHNDGFDTRKGSYNSLCIEVEKYAEEIDKLEREYVELMNSISSENRKISKDRLLSAFVKYLQSNGLEEKKGKIATLLNVSVGSFYGTVKQKVIEILNHLSVARSTVYMQQSDVGVTFSDFEEQVERCVLVAGFVKDLQQIISGDITSSSIDADSSNYLSPTNWASIFQTILLSCKNLVGQMIEVVLPDVLRSIVSFSSEVMDTFGSILQVIGSIDKALKQTVEVELERDSLVELEKNYFLNVGLVTEQQLALKEAAMKGRDHLSWEEAEEIASQEEACRTQLDQLHQTWNQKDVRDSSLSKRESSIRSALLSSESHLQSLISVDQEIENRDPRRRSLLVALDKPFSELESSDNELTSFGGHDASFALGVPGLQDLISSGYPISGFTWKFPNLMNRHSFFMWKVGTMNFLLESCVHDAALSVDKNLGFDQLLNIVKKKVETHIREHVCQYLKERVGPILLARLDKEIEFLKQRKDTANEPSFGQQNKDLAPERKIQLMLEEYCNSHETVRAAKSAASIMERRVNELKEALRKTSLEIFALEWMHDVPLNPLHNVRLISHKFLASEDNLISVILNLNRPQLLDTMRSSVSKIAGALNGLKACERTSVTAEGQLERAMKWACGGSNSSGIPPEFHNHLMRRRQLFLEAHGKSSDIINMCMSILEFEASRDGLLLTSSEVYSVRAGADGRQWHQEYLNVLTRLDAAYHSLTCTEQDLKLSQSSVEAASNALFSVTNELSVASAKAKPASGDMQSTLLAMKDCAYESSVALSAFACLSRSHTALTSESGSMLEEVLAITEGLHDIHSMGKEAAEVHRSLMKDLSMAYEVLLPLESVLTKDVAAMTDAMAREKETMMQISPIHGQAIYQSYYSRIKEASQRFKPLVAPLTVSVKELHSLLTTLARAASLHAGNLHKALEGLGESQVVESEDLNLSGPIITARDDDYDSKGGDVSSRIDIEGQEGVVGVGALSIQDKGWISPPNSISDISSGSGSTSAYLCSGDDNDPENEINRPRAGLNSEEISHNEQSEVRDLETGKGDTDSVDEYVKPEESQHDIDSPSVVETSKCLNQESAQVQVELKDDSVPLSSNKCDDKDRINPDPSSGVEIRVFRGKNPFAVSVLKRVEMKIDGRGISENRAIGIAEQVDFLLQQATSVDNLCSMYEGWTPWI